MIDVFSALAGEKLASQPNIDTPVKNIQTIDVDEAQPKKVTTSPFPFLYLRKNTH